MPLRNPFRRTGVPSGIDSPPDENGRHSDQNSGRTSSAMSIKSSRSREEPAEYKMSVVKENGVYLPPSPPPEKTGFWSRSHSSTTSSNHRNMLGENGPFNISRESFESYRRSFDISARSPVPQSDAIPPRHSVDSRSTRLPKPRHSGTNSDRHPPADEEVFEDVALSDEVKPKKRTLFSRFGDSSDANSSSASSGNSHHYGFSFTGRKRGQSGQGAELHNISRPVSAGTPEIKVGT